MVARSYGKTLEEPRCKGGIRISPHAAGPSKTGLKPRRPQFLSLVTPLKGSDDDMKGEIVYFEESRPENTDAVLSLAKRKAEDKGIRHVVVASTRGETGARAAEAFSGTGVQVVVVTHQIGPKGPELLPENEERIRALGGKIVTCTHAFGGVSSSLRRTPETEPGRPRPQPHWPAYVPSTGDLMANVLRLFSQGMKVAFEITVMAADAGAIPIGENVIAVAGQGRWADTAIVVRSANSTSFFDLDVGEILAKPITKRVPRKE